MRMVFNKITLSFPEENEILFLKKYFADSIIQFRLAFLMVTILYGAFGYLDSIVVPEYANLFYIIRFYIVVPLLSFVILLSFTRFFSKIWQILLLISFIVAGGGISVMTMLVPENYAYYAGMMLIFSAGYFFIKLRFFLASIAGWTTLLIFNIGAVFYADAGSMILISNNFFFVSANLIGMFAAYNIEYFARRDFFMNQELDRQKVVLEEVNKNLEIRTKEIEQLSYIASHDLQEPLRTLTSFAQLIKEEYAGKLDAEGDKYIDFIYNSAGRMKEMVTGLAEYSYLGKASSKVSVDCNEIVKEALADLFDSIKTSHARISAQELPTIRGYQTEMRLLFQNLVINAIKFQKKGMVPEITISAEMRKKEWLFSVKDNGIGIDEKNKDKIFVIFRRMHNHSEYKGTGIGLAHCKKIVEMHGGKIWVESSPGAGSTFLFTIPK